MHRPHGLARGSWSLTRFIDKEDLPVVFEMNHDLRVHVAPGLSF